MKKLLIASLFLTTFAALAPMASARDLVLIGHDRGGRPIYREVSQPRGRYYDDRNSSYYREAPRGRYQDDYCPPPKQHRHRSPLSFLFRF